MSNPAVKRVKLGRCTEMLSLIIASVLGAAVLMVISVHGLEVGPDSTVYIKTAKNLIAGLGYMVEPGQPLIHYPPLYPAFLACSGLVGASVLDGARWLNIVLMACNLYLIGLLIQSSLRLSFPLHIFAIAVSCLTITIMGTHAGLLSEPLFLFYFLSGLYVMLTYLREPNTGTLVGASFLWSLAFLTRYAGVFLPVTGFTAVLLLQKGKLSRRLRRATLAGILIGAPAAIWFLRNYFIADNLADRQFLFHPISPYKVVDCVSACARWLYISPAFSTQTKMLLLLLVFVFIALGGWTVIRKEKAEDRGVASVSTALFMKLILLTCGFYTAGIVFSLIFIDSSTPLNERILAPLYICFITAVFIIAGNIFHYYKAPRLLGITAVLFCSAFIIYEGAALYPVMINMHRYGRGYTSTIWKESPILYFIRTLPPDTPVYSNAPDAVEFHTGRKTSLIPVLESSGENKEDSAVNTQTNTMLTDLRENKGVLIYFSMITWRDYLISLREISVFCPELLVVYNGKDGIMCRASPDE